VIAIGCGEHARDYLNEKKFDFALLIYSVWSTVDDSSPYPVYSIARTFALKGDKKRALQSLKKSIKLGLKEKNKIATDPAFISIKDDAEFQNLIKQ